VYSSFVKGELLETDDVTAELCKLMENTYRDVNIALANELAAVAATLGIDARAAIALSNRHPRVNLMEPGIGVGGHCIPIDPWFIKEVDPANSRLIFAARTINDEMPHRVAARVRQSVRGVLDPRIVAIGAAYKPNTEDMRESPAVHVVELLRADGYEVAHYDPLVKGMAYPDTLAKACSGADCLVMLVEHTGVMAELEAQRPEIDRNMRTAQVLRF
jgi:UDP-N-acetyl-D-mannosaminuronic acid dehydrogenase